jgi:hypothetical protein
VAHVDDDKFVLLNLVINEIRITGGREHADTWNVGLAPEGRIPSQQQACDADLSYDGGRRSRTVLGNIFISPMSE